MPIFMKYLHVITAFWFIGGLIGRTLIMWRASKTTDVYMVNLLVGLAGSFERWMVIPGSVAVLGFGLATAWLQHWPLLNIPIGISANWLWLSTVLYLSVIPVIALIFVPRGKVFAAALNTALEQRRMTNDLQVAFHDRIVKYAHIYEIAVTVVVIWLMVMKPF